MQNWRYLGSETPHLAVTTVLHVERGTVWCTLCPTNIIDPVIFNGTVTEAKIKIIEGQFEGQFLPKINSSSCPSVLALAGRYQRSLDYWCVWVSDTCIWTLHHRPWCPKTCIRWSWMTSLFNGLKSVQFLFIGML
jgi:hypothetical protein